jgi:hypothetical protein
MAGPSVASHVIERNFVEISDLTPGLSLAMAIGSPVAIPIVEID